MTTRHVYRLNSELTTLSRILQSTQNLEKLVHSSKNQNLFEEADSGVLQKVLQ